MDLGSFQGPHRDCVYVCIYTHVLCIYIYVNSEMDICIYIHMHIERGLLCNSKNTLSKSKKRQALFGNYTFQKAEMSKTSRASIWQSLDVSDL